MNNIVDSMLAVSRELIAFEQDKNYDLEKLCNNSVFGNDRRYIYFLTERNRFHYSLAGKVRRLPKRFQNSASAFHGRYNEAGTVDSIEQAFDLIKAWLLDDKEVDEMPARKVRSQGIG